MITQLAEILLGALLLIAAGWDIAKRRVPNLLVLFGLLLGPALGFASGGGEGLLRAVAGVGLALVLTFPQWALRWLGGGDAKLLMVVGGFLGPAGLLVALLYAMVGQALLAVGMVLYSRARARLGRPSEGALRVPMAVPIAAAVALTLRYPLPLPGIG